MLFIFSYPYTFINGPQSLRTPSAKTVPFSLKAFHISTNVIYSKSSIQIISIFSYKEEPSLYTLLTIIEIPNFFFSLALSIPLFFFSLGYVIKLIFNASLI